MVVARIARVTHATPMNAQTTLLDFEAADGQPLGFTGGQYLIFNTGLPLPGGKVAKRAYSILSPDTEQLRFQIAVRRVGAGPGSNHLNDLKPGAEIPFSGPWGQFIPSPTPLEGEGQRAQPFAPDGVRGEREFATFVFATDTGVTAALGLLQSSKFSAQLAGTQAVWFVESGDYFIPEAEAMRRVPPGCGSFRIAKAPPIGHPDRLAVARGIIRTMLNKGAPAGAYLSGDGSLLFDLRDEIKSEGTPESGIRVETFFNHQTRKTG